MHFSVHYCWHFFGFDHSRMILDSREVSMANKKNGPISLLLTGLLFVAAGLGILYFNAYPNYKEAKKSLKWPKTKGVILKSRMIQKRVKDNEINYSPDISYSYVLNDKKYESNQIFVGSVGDSSSSSKDAYKYLDKYPVGKNVVVYYSQSENANAVLEPGVKMSHYFAFGLGFFFAVPGVFMILSALYKFFILATMAGVFLTSLFRGEEKNKTHHRFSDKRNYHESNNDFDIDLDDEMASFNKVSSTNLKVTDSPWSHKWFIKGTDKDFGPYSFEEILDYYDRGKIRDHHKCYSLSGGDVLEVSSIIQKKRVG